MWKPPANWHHKGLVRSVLNEAINYDRDLLGAASKIMALWDHPAAADAATPVEVPVNELVRYLTLVSNGKLGGPHRDAKSGRSVPRYVFAAVPIARLLMSARKALRDALDEHYVIGRPIELSLREERAERAEERAALEDQISDLQTEVLRANEAKDQAAARARKASATWRERCTAARAKARETALECARAEVADEHEALRKQKQQFREKKNQQAARARAAEAKVDSLQRLAAARLEKAQAAAEAMEAAIANADDLQE